MLGCRHTQSSSRPRFQRSPDIRLHRRTQQRAHGMLYLGFLRRVCRHVCVQIVQALFISL